MSRAIPEIWLPNFGDQGLNENGGEAINNSYPKVGYLLHIPESGQITHIGFRTRIVTTSEALNVGLYVPDTSTGSPTTTQYGGSAYGTLAAQTSYTTYEVPLATPALATKGDAVAVVYARTGSSGDIQIRNVRCSYLYQPFPALMRHNGTSWSTPSNTSKPNVYLKTTTGRQIVPLGCHAQKSSGYSAIRLDTTPDEVGFCFVANVPFIVSAFRYATTGWAAQCELCIYENGSLLTKVTQPFSSVGFDGPRYLPLPLPVILTPGSTYHVTYRPPVASEFYYYSTDYINIELMRASFRDPTICGCQRTDGGAWTYTEKIPYFSLVCSGIADTPINRRTSTGR